jgi:molybdate transport system substrate-binding protein
MKVGDEAGRVRTGWRASGERGPRPRGRRGGFGSRTLLSTVLVGAAVVTVVGGWLLYEKQSPSAGGGERLEVRVAVAANFAEVQSQLAERFEKGTGHRVVASVGSTGQLYAQVMNGAQFDVFLSADAKRIDLLEQAGADVDGTRFTYAVGRLAMFAPARASLRSVEVELRDTANRKIAIANPATAPYGDAAMQMIEHLGLRPVVATRLVRGESVTQTYQFVKTGAAEIGFVALSQVLKDPERTYSIVPQEMHRPIVQDAVMLVYGETNPAARAYLEFLRGEVAKRIIRAAGYETR